MVLFDVDLSVPKGGARGDHGPQRRREDDAAAGRRRPDPGAVGQGAARRRGRHQDARPNRRVRNGLGYVPQGQLCFPQMTTMENLQLVSTVKSEIDEVLDTFPALTGLLSRRAGLLSGGQRQQLAIARTLLAKPRLLILDEPTEGIQPNVVAEIEQVIVELTRRGDITVLLVEQHVGFALRSTDMYYVLESGRITGTGRGRRGLARRGPCRDGGLRRRTETLRKHARPTLRGCSCRPTSRNGLLVHVAADVAAKRRARGLKLNYPETVAILTSWVYEAARDGRTVVDLMDAGCRVLTTRRRDGRHRRDGRRGADRGHVPRRHQARHAAPADPVGARDPRRGHRPRRHDRAQRRARAHRRWRS